MPSYQWCLECYGPFKWNDSCAVYPCKHTFHRRCSDAWRAKPIEGEACPVCRSAHSNRIVNAAARQLPLANLIAHLRENGDKYTFVPREVFDHVRDPAEVRFFVRALLLERSGTKPWWSEKEEKRKKKEREERSKEKEERRKEKEERRKREGRNRKNQSATSRNLLGGEERSRTNVSTTSRNLFGNSTTVLSTNNSTDNSTDISTNITTPGTCRACCFSSCLPPPPPTHTHAPSISSSRVEVRRGARRKTTRHDDSIVAVMMVLLRACADRRAQLPPVRMGCVDVQRTAHASHVFVWGHMHPLEAALALEVCARRSDLAHLSVHGAVDLGTLARAVEANSRSLRSLVFTRVSEQVKGGEASEQVRELPTTSIAELVKTCSNLEALTFQYACLEHRDSQHLTSFITNVFKDSRRKFSFSTRGSFDDARALNLVLDAMGGEVGEENEGGMVWIHAFFRSLMCLPQLVLQDQASSSSATMSSPSAPQHAPSSIRPSSSRSSHLSSSTHAIPSPDQRITTARKEVSIANECAFSLRALGRAVPKVRVLEVARCASAFASASDEDFEALCEAASACSVDEKYQRKVVLRSNSISDERKQRLLDAFELAWGEVIIEG